MNWKRLYDRSGTLLLQGGMTIFAALLALILGGIFLAAMGASPLEVYGVMFERAITSFDSVLRRAMVLMLAGLAVAIPMRSGMLNMGGEGQIAAGALTAAVVGSTDLGLPAGVHMLVALAAAVLVGMLLSGLPALLSIRRGVSEVVVTIMLNNILAYLITWLVMNPFRGSEYSPQTAMVLEGARIPALWRGSNVSWGLVAAIMSCLLAWIFLEKSPAGLQLKAAGLNAEAARYQRVKTGSMGMLGMLLGGAAAAAGGAFEVLGGSFSYTDASFLQYGFDGIAIAFMAHNHPVGTIFAAIFFSMIRVGALVVSRRTGISTYYVTILQGLMITLLVAPAFIQMIWIRCAGILRHPARKGAGI